MFKFLKRLPAVEVHFSTGALKWIGFGCLCAGSLSSAVLQRAVIGVGDYTDLTLHDAMAGDTGLFLLVSLASVLSLVAVLALPIYAKLLYEGWRHTGSQRRYLVRLLLCAVIAEIPYDLVYSNTPFYWAKQGPLWGLVIALLALNGLRMFDRVEGAMGVAVKAFLLIAACAWTVLLQSYLGIITVILVALFYFLEEHPVIRTISGAVVCCLQLPAPFGMIFVHFHDRQPVKAPKLLFYILYPAQLLLFYGIGQLLLVL